MADLVSVSSKKERNPLPHYSKIYASNDDKPIFFQDFLNHLLDFQCTWKFNYRGGKDKKGGLAKTHSNSIKLLHDFIAKLDLIDAWRVLNHDK